MDFARSLGSKSPSPAIRSANPPFDFPHRTLPWKALPSRFQEPATAASRDSLPSAPMKRDCGGASSTLRRFRRNEAATKPCGSRMWTKRSTFRRSQRREIARRGTKREKANRKRFDGEAEAIWNLLLLLLFLRFGARFAALADAAIALIGPTRKRKNEDRIRSVTTRIKQTGKERLCGQRNPPGEFDRPAYKSRK